MTDPRPLPGLATDAELAAGIPVVECQDCHRALTGREARMWGRGWACRHKHGLGSTGRGAGRFDVPQDGLFDAG